jgi:tetratricopeptide (TPR) repeat protein
MVSRLKIVATQLQRLFRLGAFMSLSGMACLLSGSPSLTAIPQQLRVEIAQQPANTNAVQVLREASKLLKQGTTESIRQAIPKLEQAALLSRQAGDKVSEAVSLLALGSAYLLLGEQRKSLEYYKQALPLTRAVGSKGGEAMALSNIGHIYNLLEEKQKALEFYNQVLPLYRSLGDESGEATTLTGIGFIYDSLGEKQKALEFYNQALSLFRVIGNRDGEVTTLNNIGDIYNSLGEKQKALELYNQVLPLFQAMGDRGREALTLNNIGRVYNSMGEKQKALEFYNRSLLLRRTLGDKNGEATTLNEIALAYSDLGEKLKAFELHQQALVLARAVGNQALERTILRNIETTQAKPQRQKSEAQVLIDEGLKLFQQGSKESLQQASTKFTEAIRLGRLSNDKPRIAWALLATGLVSSRMGDLRKALELYDQALPLMREVGDRSGEATTLNNIGLVYSDLGEKQKALKFYEEALSIRREIVERVAEATTLTNMGTVYSDLGEKQKSLELFTQALSIFRALGDRSREATVLNNIGRVYSDLGEYQKALELFNQALPIFRSVGNPSMEAITLSNIGAAYSDLGEKQKALDFYDRALPILRAAGDRIMEATVTSNVGGVYSDLGEQEKALEFLNQALRISQALGHRSSEARTLHNIGDVYLELGETKKALTFYNQALSLRRETSDRLGEARTLNSIGLVYHYLGEKLTALEFYNQARLLSRAMAHPSGEATTLNNIGGVYDNLGQKQKALEFYQQALPLMRVVGNRSGEANTLRNIAWIYRQQNKLPEALSQINAAIALIEQLRSNLQDPNLKTSYFATVQDYYQLKIDLLMQLHQQTPNQGYDALALHTSERARARTLLEQLTEARLNLKSGLDPTLLAEEKRLTQAFNTADQKRRNLLSNPKGYSNPDLEAAKAEINDILQQFQRLEAQIRRANPAYANLRYPDPLTLKGIQDKLLDNNTLLLQYALGPERSYLFLVSKTGLKTYTLPPQAEIEAAVEQYRQLLQSPSFKDLSQGQPLSQLLLGQIAGELKGQRLVIVGDRKLQLLPFAALPWGTGANPAPLLANHEIITLPSATSLAVQRDQWQTRPKAPKALAVLADPVFKANDPRLGGNGRTIASGDLSQEPSLRSGCGDFDRLLHTAAEAEQILSLVPDAQRFSALGFDANYATATNPTLSQYQILHLATHGCIQDNPLLSNLALSSFQANGQAATTPSLKLQDIYNLKLNADLVVLSACQTGTGKEVQGEGVVGLTRGFMYAGARRVVVSLWSVNDRATSILMGNYYRQMLQQRLDPAAALQKTQLAMWQSGDYSAPYYWAAFTLQGDW